MKNLKLDLSNIKIIDNIDINIKLENNLLDGGVYMFLLDDVLSISVESSN